MREQRSQGALHGLHGLDALPQVLYMLLCNAFDPGTGARSVMLKTHQFGDLTRDVNAQAAELQAQGSTVSAMAESTAQGLTLQAPPHSLW